MYEIELSEFQQELGKIKHDLLSGATQDQSGLNDASDYQIATKIDLLVSRLLRILERE